MKILSLFDWISCGRVALERAGITVDKYFASEIDKHATQVSQNNYPDIVRLWDVNNWKEWDIWEIDMIIGGSPCQWFSFAGKQLAFDDPRSKLFFTMVDIINHYKPKYFLLENVVMKKEYQDIISEYLWVQPIEINSCLVSAQNRKRLYRTNIPWVSLPQDMGIALNSVLQRGVDSRYYLSQSEIERMEDHGAKYSFWWRMVWYSGKYPTIIKSYGKTSWNSWKIYDKWVRILTEIECERLQTLPDNYTQWISIPARYSAVWNWWTVDIIAHIFSSIQS